MIIKQLLTLILVHLASRAVMGDTHTYTHQHSWQTLNRTSVHPDHVASDLHGISVQDLKSCQVIFGLRRPMLFLPSDVKEGSLMSRFKS